MKISDKELYMMAKDAFVNSYAPYSEFHVGAALVASNGKEEKVFTGVNVENASYGATICAERTAAVKAVSEGYREFKKIAVCSDHGAAPMCGICRQFLSEFAKDMTVITGDDEDNLKIESLDMLLPSQFVLEH